ncbi:MAG: protein kinase, partial [Planctomycetes bacterium]|nr:protein kinase [Planctomycetota bacterium]
MLPYGSEEILLGKLALAHGLVTREQLDFAVAEQEASRRPLGEVLVARGFISAVDLATLLAEQDRNLQKRHSTTLIRKQDSLFGKVAVALHLVRPEDAHRCVREQAMLGDLGRRVRLGKIMVERHFLTIEQVGQILEYQKKQILCCDACDTLFNAPIIETSQVFKCRNCGAALAAPSSVTHCDVEELFLPTDDTQIAPGSRPGPNTPSTKPEETTDPPPGTPSATKSTIPPLSGPLPEHDDWFLVREGRPVGPFEYKAMRRMAEQGILAPTTFVWRPEMDAWLAAGDVPEVAAVFTSPASETAIVAPPVGAMPEGVSPPALDGFHISGYLGKGGLGHVFRAKQIAMDREVAIRSLDLALAKNTEFTDRLVRDSRAAARVNHPGIVQWIDMRQGGGTWHFISEFVQGPRVSDLVANGGALAEGRALEIARQAAQALDGAHRIGVMHRDIRPEAIQITEDGQAKICDLGLTRRPGHSKDGSPGTPPFSAPEARAGRGDARSDIYSLGATLYQMVTGSAPPDTPGADPRYFNAAVSPATAALVVRMMSREPEARHPNAGEAAKEMDAILASFQAARPPAPMAPPPGWIGSTSPTPPVGPPAAAP